MDGPEAVREIAKQVGGKITEMGRLPDGSGFARMSMPLRKDHWIYDGDRKESYGVFNVQDTEDASGKGMRLPVPGSFLFLAVRFRP